MKDRNSRNSTKRQQTKLRKQARLEKQAKVPWHRRWLAKVWLTYGGGLYAVGYAVTFLYLEVRTILEEIVESTGVLDFLTNNLLDFVFRFASDSIANMVHAFIWFVPMLGYRSPLGIILLGIGFLVFDIYLRKPVGDWLLREESESPP